MLKSEMNVKSKNIEEKNSMKIYVTIYLIFKIKDV